jgi:DNA-binding NarL/FixJ family response regulator
VNKARPPQEIAGAVKKVMAGERYITPEIAQKLAEAFAGTREQQLHETLSNREMEVLRRIAEGKTVKEIAGELKLSVPTVGTYRARLLEKMGLKTNGQLMRYALDHRLAD